MIVTSCDIIVRPLSTEHRVRFVTYSLRIDTAVTLGCLFHSSPVVFFLRFLVLYVHRHSTAQVLYIDYTFCNHFASKSLQSRVDSYIGEEPMVSKT